jgi:hypothetical protein
MACSLSLPLTPLPASLGWVASCITFFEQVDYWQGGRIVSCQGFTAFANHGVMHIGCRWVSTGKPL